MSSSGSCLRRPLSWNKGSQGRYVIGVSRSACNLCGAYSAFICLTVGPLTLRNTLYPQFEQVGSGSDESSFPLTGVPHLEHSYIASGKIFSGFSSSDILVAKYSSAVN